MEPTLLIGDIVEKEASERTHSADFSDVPSSSTGFPKHKRRWKSSAFKQQRAGNVGAAVDEASQLARGGQGTSQGTQGTRAAQQGNFEEMDRQRIDKENRQKIESMSPEDIARAQDDLMNGLNPALVQRLLRRANIDEPSGPSPFDPQPSEPSPQAHDPPEIKTEDPPEVHVEAERQPAKRPITTKKIPKDYDEDAPPAQIPPDLFPISDPPKSTHFPVPPRKPDLDPSDPNFLATLHEKYFPDLPADPSKLAWMAPVPSQDSPADKESPYYPHPEISVSALRFDFRGRFLSPRISRDIPSTKGLHHHGLAPEAAGYTIAELARLARSAVPAQRCVAFQTLGRIMYRLGRGEWGKTENDPIATGVWSAVKEGRVLETLAEAAMVEGGHRSSQAYATEALWLFEKGGWKEKFQGR